MGIPIKIIIIALILTILILPIVSFSSQSTVFASSHEEESDSKMDMDDGSGGTTGMKDTQPNGQTKMGDGAGGTMEMDDSQPMEQMKMGVTNTWQDQINKISYPVTAIFALLALWVCFLLMRATGMTDKFGLISIGLFLFLVQAVVGVLFYLSNGTIVTMPTLMFVMSLFNSLALLLIGSAFYRWKKMIG